jgi:hypothetical protein
MESSRIIHGRSVRRTASGLAALEGAPTRSRTWEIIRRWEIKGDVKGEGEGDGEGDRGRSREIAGDRAQVIAEQPARHADRTDLQPQPPTNERSAHLSSVGEARLISMQAAHQHAISQ